MSNRLWLYSQMAMAVVAAVFAIVGVLIDQFGGLVDNSIALRVNSYFLLPGVVISLVVNQILLLKRSAPRIVTNTERVLLAVEYATIVLLVVCSSFGLLTWIAVMLAICVVPLAIAVLVLIVSGNTQRRSPEDPNAVGAPFATPAPGERIG